MKHALYKIPVSSAVRADKLCYLCIAGVVLEITLSSKSIFPRAPAPPEAIATDAKPYCDFKNQLSGLIALHSMFDAYR
jgi:hypothetical protein